MAKKATNRDPATDRPGDPAEATITGAATAAADPPGIDADDLDDVYDDDEPRERCPPDHSPYARLAVIPDDAYPADLNEKLARHCEAASDAVGLRGKAERLANVDEATARLPLDDLRKRRQEIDGLAIRGLQMELRLSEARKVLLGDVVNALAVAVQSARQAIQAAEDRTREDLSAIGYKTESMPGAAEHTAPAERQINAIVAQNPGVLAAKKNYQERAAAFSRANQLLANADAVRNEIAAELRQAVAAFLKSA